MADSFRVELTVSEKLVKELLEVLEGVGGYHTDEDQSVIRRARFYLQELGHYEKARMR